MVITLDRRSARDNPVHKIPGYIEGSTSMYSAYWIFGHCSSLGTKYSYSSSKKRVTLQRNSQKLVMTLNSRTATLNGKKFTLPSAPRKIRYIAKKKNYIMVPGDIVAKKLGFVFDGVEGAGLAVLPFEITPDNRRFSMNNLSLVFLQRYLREP